MSPAEKGLEARALAELTRQRIVAARTAAAAAEAARKAAAQQQR